MPAPIESRWKIFDKPEGVRRLSQELDLHPAATAALLRRGYQSPAEIFSFLDPDITTLERPSAFTQMDKAVQRLRKAVAASEPILLYGDYDVDGVTATAILHLALTSRGARVEAHLPHRSRDGYGINRSSLETILSKGDKPGLIVTLDNGLGGEEAIRFLAAQGIDVIVIDHHLAKEHLPPAHAIVSAAVGGGDPALTAAGVAFKTAWAFLGDLKDAAPYLDLAALGTIADVAPALGENRTILRHGLALITSGSRLGLRCLVRRSRLQGVPIGYREAAFSLIPRLNAAGRMGCASEAMRLLVCRELSEAESLTEALEKGNRERQKVEARTFAEARKRVDAESGFAGESVLVVAGEGWHEGVLGIVAARLTERYGKPSLAITHREGIAKGSARSVPSVRLHGTLARCEDLFLSFGGHDQACGFTLPAADLAELRRRLNEGGSAVLGPERAPVLQVEAEIDPREIDLKFLKDLERLGPFGPGHRRPLFLSRRMRVKVPAKKRGTDTLCLWMSDETGRTVCEVVGRKLYGRWKNEEGRQTLFDIVYRPVLVEQGGIVSAQLELEDWRAAQA